MSAFLEGPIYALLLLLPPAALLVSFSRQRQRNAEAALAPFTELRRRPAGESLRVQIDELNDHIHRWMVAAASMPVIIALILAAQPAPDALSVSLFFLSAALFCGAAQRGLLPLLRRRSCYKLGYQGERYVAEELNRLIAFGYQAFHDVPFDNGNMDHVLVGPTGVFVIETKTTRKPAVPEEGEKLEVVFDGTALLFPDGPDAGALERVRRNRDALSRWLSSATADQTCAEGILTIPGWNIARISRSDIYVLNPKQIRQLVLSCKQYHLSPAQIQRASHQLEQKCTQAVE